MSRHVDLDPEGAPLGLCVVLPGRHYTADGPLLFFAAQVALAHGWQVRQVWWEPPQRGSLTVADEAAWVGNHLDAALEAYDGRVLVVAKSLGTLAAGRAAERGLDAVWLTPLLADPDAAAPLASYPASQFVAIGADDPYLDREVLDRLPGTHVVVPGDHVLRVLGDVAAMLDSHARVSHAFEAWLTHLTPDGSPR